LLLKAEKLKMLFRVFLSLAVILFLIGYIRNQKMEKGKGQLLSLSDHGIYIIDYSGKISLNKGLSNMELIEKEIRNLPINNGRLKIVLDMRNTTWENRLTHDTLSKIGRKIFNPNNFNFVIYTAVLNNDITGFATEYEHWFVQKEDAIQWLMHKE
jgi:hypothetical protein